MKLTIVSPAYNEAENIGLLAQAISSALDGAGIDYEILIVDDDSPGLTWRRASEIGRMNPSVRVLRRTRAPGLSASVIEGFSNAQGEIVACIDTDLQHAVLNRIGSLPKKSLQSDTQSFPARFCPESTQRFSIHCA